MVKKRRSALFQIEVKTDRDGRRWETTAEEKKVVKCLSLLKMRQRRKQDHVHQEQGLIIWEKKNIKSLKLAL